MRAWLEAVSENPGRPATSAGAAEEHASAFNSSVAPDDSDLESEDSQEDSDGLRVGASAAPSDAKASGRPATAPPVAHARGPNKVSSSPVIPSPVILTPPVCPNKVSTIPFPVIDHALRPFPSTRFPVADTRLSGHRKPSEGIFRVGYLESILFGSFQGIVELRISLPLPPSPLVSPPFLFSFSFPLPLWSLLLSLHNHVSACVASERMYWSTRAAASARRVLWFSLIKRSC